jgi:deaminated glutathione amidase
MLKIKAMANETLKIAVCQTSSTLNIDANLKNMRRWGEDAAAKGAKVICFAEMAYFTASGLENRRSADRFDELCETFSNWSKEWGVYFSPGSLRSADEGGKSFNRAVFFSPEGKRIGDYKKIFLFKANLPDRVYDESALYSAGEELSLFPIGSWKAALSICFDLRFPEMFRFLRNQGAQIIFIPSAFTVPTGKAHWEVLLRARAIENQCYVIAPSLCGKSGDGSEKYGHSMIVDPWGEVLAQLGENEGVAMAELRTERFAEVQKVVDALASRRLDLFPIA